MHLTDTVYPLAKVWEQEISGYAEQLLIMAELTNLGLFVRLFKISGLCIIILIVLVSWDYVSLDMSRQSNDCLSWWKNKCKIWSTESICCGCVGPYVHCVRLYNI